MGPDFRILVAKARKIAQAYYKVYGEYPPTKVLVQEVAGVLQKATQSGYVPVLYGSLYWTLMR
jgi:20S proteasome subunit alpha 2